MMSSMQRERYEKAVKLFDEAMALRPEDRTGFLTRAVTDDVELLRHVQRLIGYADRAEPTAGLRPEGLSGDRHRANSAANLVGKTVGRFHLIELIGEGAFGAVYRAEQSVPVRRTVAVKVLKAGMDSQQILARFDAERQALAMMEHPGIARVIDAGQTDASDGSRPYFVMEFVTGEPITVVCDRAHMDLEARLELFCLVCQAIQHAHRRGIIHRDLKPSNILVSQVDGVAMPKVIDFGIAKALHQPLTNALLVTNRMELLGTPRYMSPEQADANEQAIDTRTDVYSLGVVLYELLTGTPPLDEQALQGASYSRIIELIKDLRIERPSTRVSHARTATGVPEPGNQNLPSLVRRLRGELDWILLKALDTDRERRYDSPAALADDLQRYLRHEPVLAGPPSAIYRMRKFIRRHRVGVGATTLLAITLIGGVIGTSIGLWRTTQARALAEREAVKAKQIATFSQQMLAGINPSIARGKDTQLLRIILDEAVARVDKDLADQPEVEAAIRTTIGVTNRAIAQYELARPQLERSLAIRREILGNDHPDTQTSVYEMAYLLYAWGKLTEAEPYCQESLVVRQRILGPDHKDTLNSVTMLANLRWDQGRLKEAESYFQTVLDCRRRMLGNANPETLLAMNNIGSILRDQGKLSEAEVYFRESLDGHRRAIGNDHPNTLAAITNMGRLLSSQGKLPEAETLIREGVDGYRRVMGVEHPATLAAINSMGALLQKQGKFVEAEQMYREAFEVRRRTLGADHFNTLVSLNNVGSVLVEQGRFDEARTVSAEVLERQQRTLGPDHPDTLRSMHNMGGVLEKLGQYEEAKTFYEKALEARRAKFGDKSPVAASTAFKLASMLLTSKVETVRDPKRALQLALEANAATDNADAEYLDLLAKAYFQNGRVDEAVKNEEKAISVLPPDSPFRDEYEQRQREYQAQLTHEKVSPSHGTLNSPASKATTGPTTP